MADEMERLAALQQGYLGIESARDANGLGITISYWASEESIRAWRGQADHEGAQKLGRERWYASYAIRVCRVERASDFSAH